MHHWDRDSSGRLQRISTPVEQGCEISVHSDQMDPLPEEHQSQQGTPMNPTEYRSMRDHIHPPRVSAPSCIIPPAEGNSSETLPSATASHISWDGEQKFIHAHKGF